jgi:hypothetical protein
MNPGTMQERGGESLLLGNGQQLALLEVDAEGLPAAAYALGERAGQFTGERIFSTNPKLYRVIVALLARSVPYREISEICGVSVNTVCAVSQREGVPVETIRERVGRIGLDVAYLTMEAIRDLMADPEWRRAASARDLAIIHGIAFQNAQLALGGVTSRIETVEANPGHDDYLKFLRTVTEVTASVASVAAIGSAAETRGAKGDGATAAIEVRAESAGGSAQETNR